MQIQEIETVLLCHHPDNPRQSYGDIEELKESIIQQGILQPLTVVRIGLGRHYNVVAGNRRLEAAKAAGLKTCPCIVSDMDEKTQATVILVENMVRKNLNPYEECKGVQLCLDLGMDEAELSKKTGFSKEMIRHRKKMSELDQKVLKNKCEGGQISIQEIISLEKVKDPKTKNDLLEKAGTSNFAYSLQTAIRDEEMEKNRQKAYKILLTFAEEMPVDWMDTKYRQVAYSLTGDIEVPEDAGEAEYAFKLSWSASKTYSLYKAREDIDETSEEPQESPYEMKRQKETEAKAKLDQLGETLYELRKIHMKKVTTFKGNIIQWLAYVILAGEFTEDEEHPDGFPWSEDVNIYGSTEIYHEIMGSKDDKTTEAVVKDMRFDNSKDPIASTVLIYSILETKIISCADWRGHFNENDQEYARLYSFMELCGYELSDTEKQILDGTHEYYYEEED